MRTAWKAVLTAVVGTGMIGTGSAGAAPAAIAPDATTEIAVICDQIGEDTVTITGDLAGGGTATIEDGPLTIVGEPGFTGTDVRGRSIDVDPTGEGALCTAQTETTAGSLQRVLPPEQATSAASTGRVEGELTFTVDVDLDEVLAAAPRPRVAAAASLPFEAELRTYLNSRPGAVGVAVRLPGTGKSWTYTKQNDRNVTASIVKVQIMAAVMMRAQSAGRALTASEKALISPMIRNSDNNATTSLFNSIGGRAALDRAGDRLGMASTRADSGGRWGLTTTNALDQTTLMQHFARPSSVLSATNRMYGLSLMRSINSSQDWGVSAGPPKGKVALKNGWLPRTDGWHVNSIGWQNNGSADYTIGVLTHHNPGAMSTQISTIEGVSRIVYKNRNALLGSTTPPAPKARGISGDWDGDGKVDMLTVSEGGNLYAYKGNGSGGFAAKRLVKTGLSGYNWFGVAGDVNRDGRSDVLLRTNGGQLRIMYATSSGGFTNPTKVRDWFASYTDIASGYDVDGDGALDVLGRLAGGEIVRFRLADNGTMTKVGSMGKPVQYYPKIDLVADVNGDGRADLRGFATGGRTRTWTSGANSWRQTSATSLGWDQFALISSPGDLNRTATKQDDVIGITPGGTVRLYWGTSGGGTSGPITVRTTAHGMKYLL